MKANISTSYSGTSTPSLTLLTRQAAFHMTLSTRHTTAAGADRVHC